MKAQVLYGINDLKYEENYSLPLLKKGEVLVHVCACGICGSDIDRVTKNGTYHFPTIIGHEFSGEVIDVYDEENKNLINRRVSIFPLIPCNKCDSCRNGNYQLCENYNYLGSRCDGGFAEYVAVPSWNLLEIPNGVSFEEAAMLEPCAVAVHSLNLAGELNGKTVMITGSGTISSILVQVALSKGAKNVVLLARNNEKMDFIKSTCSNIYIVNSDEGGLCGVISKLVGALPDIVIEGTGASEMLSNSINIIKRKGIIVVLGNPANDIFMEKKVFWQILRKELVVKGTWNSSFNKETKNDWTEVFDLIVNKKLKLRSLITHKLNLKDLSEGINLMKSKKELSNKVMVVNYEE